METAEAVKRAVPVSDDSFDLEISPDEIRDARKEEDENLPGQMQFGMEEKGSGREFSGGKRV